MTSDEAKVVLFCIGGVLAFCSTYPNAAPRIRKIQLISGAIFCAPGMFTLWVKALT